MSAPTRRIRIGVTLGDVNGIGPEVAIKALFHHAWPADVKFFLIGPHDLTARLAREGARRTLRAADPQADADPQAFCSLWDPSGLSSPYRPGQPLIAASKLAAANLRAAAAACLRRDLHGMVTAPISKLGFHRAGIRVPGHTEMLAALTGTTRFAMMLFGGPLRVVLATRHLPLAQVPKALTPALLREQIELTAEALPWLGFPRARVAVCGLNPHAGEGGDIGREEIDVIAPAIAQARRRGLNVVGPVPGDTVFHQAAAGAYDAVLAMYHDQGLAPLKLIAFDEGVNLTLGLPLLRTSPDHGTAFDIAGQDKAREASMVAALRAALRLARRRNPWARDRS